jgi:hypothetical protein
MRHEAALFRMRADAKQRIETARVHRDSWGRGSGLAACHAQLPVIAGDRGFLKARLPISGRSSRLRSARL